jgi:hypothetical protein
MNRRPHGCNCPTNCCNCRGRGPDPGVAATFLLLAIIALPFVFPWSLVVVAVQALPVIVTLPIFTAIAAMALGIIAALLIAIGVRCAIALVRLALKSFRPIPVSRD